VGIPSSVYGEVPVAYVVVSGEREPTESQNVAVFLAGRIASYKIPVAIHFMDALPRNVNRKIDRKLLIARAREEFSYVVSHEAKY
jgi:long-chain acyl-CoA synthetase